MLIVNLEPLDVVSAAPVSLPTVKPENVMAPALALFVTSSKQEPSAVGAVIVNAPPFVMLWFGLSPQSIVTFPVGSALLVTVAPPVTSGPSLVRRSAANGAGRPN